MYPSQPPKVDPQLLADNMLPEGSDKFGVLHTYFSIGRKSSKELNKEFAAAVHSSKDLQRQFQLEGPDVTVACALFEILDCTPKKLYQHAEFAIRRNLVVSHGQQIVLEIEPHPFLNFKALNNKCYFNDKAGKTYMVETADFDFSTVSHLQYDPYQLVET
jgi:hypothetical protein